MTKEEKEMLTHLLNKAIEFDCFLIEKDLYYIYPDNHVVIIDEDGDVVMKEVVK